MARKHDQSQDEQAQDVMEQTDGVPFQSEPLSGADTVSPTVSEDNPFRDAAVESDDDGAEPPDTAPASADNQRPDASQRRLDEARQELGDNAPQRSSLAPDEGLNGTEDVIPLGVPNPAPSPSLASQRGYVFGLDPDSDEARDAQVWAFEPPTNEDKPFGNRIDVSGDQQILPVGPLDVHEYLGGGTNIEEQQKIRRTVADAQIENPVVTRLRHDSSPVVSSGDPQDPTNSVLR